MNRNPIIPFCYSIKDKLKKLSMRLTSVLLIFAMALIPPAIP